MRRLLLQVGSFGFMLAIVLGCRSTNPELKPAKQPEEFNLPPQGEARFDSPYYPKEALARDDLAKKLRDGNAMSKGMPGMGGMGGMGGMPGR